MSKDRLVGSLSSRQSFLETRMALLCQRALPGQGGPPETFSRTVFRLLHTDGLIAQSPETWDPSLQDLLETGDLLFLWMTYKRVQNTAVHWYTEALQVFSVCKHPLSTPKPLRAQACNTCHLSTSHPEANFESELNQLSTGILLPNKVREYFLLLAANKVTSIFPFLSAHSILGRESR